MSISSNNLSFTTPVTKRRCLSLLDCPPAPRPSRPSVQLKTANLPSLPLIFNDIKSSTESSDSDSSETTEAAVPKAKPVNEMSSFNMHKLNKRQRPGLSIKEAMLLLKQSRHLDDCDSVERMESSHLPISKAA
ncbi:hypothetical protein ACHAXN_000747 [Cyclotella atomus]